MSGKKRKVLAWVITVLVLLGLGIGCYFMIPVIRVRMDKKYIKNQTLDCMLRIPDRDYEVQRIEVTQKLYLMIMGENPSYCNQEMNKKWKQLPVEYISWFDAICFCNRLSVELGLTPAFAVDGETDVDKWGYVPHQGDSITGNITMDMNCDGFRLATEQEWEYAARGGEKHFYAGSDDIDEVCWYQGNSGGTSHPVASKKPNAYGLYDMSGNVWEWCWDPDPKNYRLYKGGSWKYYAPYCKVVTWNYYMPYYQFVGLGMRLVRSCNQ